VCHECPACCCGFQKIGTFSYSSLMIKTPAMDDLRMSLYVALRTAPKSVKSRYAKARLPVDGDRAAHDLTEIIMKSLERYDIIAKEPDRTKWPTTRPPSQG